MSNNDEKLKNKGQSAFKKELNPNRPFGTFNPMQQERIITNMNTIGSKKEEMRRFNDSMRNSESGIEDTL